jgi:hypothetical protein
MLSFVDSPKAIALIKHDNNRNLDIVYYHDEKSKELKPRVNRTDYLNYEDFKNPNKRYDLSKYAISRLPRDIERGKLNPNNYYDDEEDVFEYKNAFNRINNNIEDRINKSIKINSGIFQMLPRFEDNQREFILVSGPSGSGKSTWTSSYIEMYHQLFPKNRIIIISKKTDEPEFDKLNYVKFIDIDKEWLDGEPLDTDDFENSLVVFDDIENVHPKVLRDEVYRLKDSLIETGRSKNIYIILCNHLSMNGNQTRKDLNESDTIVIFPSNSSHYHLDRLLRTYCGIDKKKVEYILKVPSRWCVIKKHVPRYCITENEIFLL